MKIALIGCGRIAQDHAKNLKKLVSDAKLVFCDRNLDKAEKCASRFSPDSTAYSEFHLMLESEAPEAVHILTQPASHFELAVAALEAGAHVYLEKPVTESLADLVSLQTLAASRQRVLYPGYSTLGHPAVQKAKNIIATGAVGDLISMHCNFNVAPPVGTIPYGNPEHWAYFLKGGILQNVIDHPLSLLADVLDNAEVRDVCVLRRADLPQGSPNLMHVTVCNDKQIGSLTLSYANGNASASVAYFLEGGTINVDLRGFTFTAQYGTGPQSLVRRFKSGMVAAAAIGMGTAAMLASRLIGRTTANPGIGGLITNFYSVINGDSSPIVSDSTARAIVGQLESIWAKAETDRPESTHAA